MDTTFNYSPNFEVKKRKANQIKFVIFHYTGMKSEKEAINKLTNSESKVSCHYFIKNNGEILSLVPDLYIAWHSGISRWKKYKSLNKYSIGIEINNSGHDIQYKKFSNNQITAITKLSRFLIKKYQIKPSNFLGHSDIAPDRKKDPGEKFPWKYLSKKKIGFWHNLNDQILFKERKKFTNNFEKIKFIENLFEIGYPKNFRISKNVYSKILSLAFQRRFRQELINGVIDQECLSISKNLLKKSK
tara:strand:+ start:5511 stop:6242 length:732 start_codon:yes stop_codon:yes gene_type:complete